MMNFPASLAAVGMGQIGKPRGAPPETRHDQQEQSVKQESWNDKANDVGVYRYIQGCN